MGNSFVLFDVSIVISQGQFHCGNRGHTQNTDFPWVKSHFPVGKRSSGTATIGPRALANSDNIIRDGLADKPHLSHPLFVWIPPQDLPLHRTISKVAVNVLSPAQKKHLKTDLASRSPADPAGWGGGGKFDLVADIGVGNLTLYGGGGGVWGI